MRQRILAVLTKFTSVVLAGKVDSQYLVGSARSTGHSINNHCSLVEREAPLRPMRRPHSHRGKARRQFARWFPRATPPCASSALSRFRHPLHAERCGARHTLPPCRQDGRFSCCLGRHRPRASRPHGGDRLYPHAILQLHLVGASRHAVSIAIACVGQHHADGNPRGLGHSDLLSAMSGLV